MPRGQKSKLRAREKRRQTRGEHRATDDEKLELEISQGKYPIFDEAVEVDIPFVPIYGGSLPSSPTGSLPMGFLRVRSNSSPGSLACEEVSTEMIVNHEGHVRMCARAAWQLLSPDCCSIDPLTRKAGMLVQFLLHKYKTKEPITKNGMMKIVTRKYRDNFPEILRRTAERMELVFGLDLKEVDPITHSYLLISKLNLSSERGLSGGLGLPKNGLLMPLLGVIFMSGNHASEEEVWEFLNMLGIYDGKRHFIFGEPRKLLTHDLVREQYLEYRQVPGSQPPCFEFLWGPRAYMETSKMQVLEFMAKVNDTVPRAFLPQYEEALKEEEERAKARAAAREAARARHSAKSHELCVFKKLGKPGKGAPVSK